MIDKQNGPDPIFVAGGAAATFGDENFAKASLVQNGKGNNKIKTSGLQDFWPDDQKNIYSAGAGFLESPKVRELMKNSVPPQSYAQGLKGGIGKGYFDFPMEGGFGGGGAEYLRNKKNYFGAGGGFTGGSTKVFGNNWCIAGGGGSFSVDKNATFDHVFVEYGKCKIEFEN